MKKTVKYNGENIKVEFEYKKNSEWDSEEWKLGAINRIVGYDFIINGRLFRVVMTCTGIIRRGKYAGEKYNNAVLTVPEHLEGIFTENHKDVIEALLIKYPELLN